LEAKREISPQATGKCRYQPGVFDFVVTTTFTRQTELRVDLPEAVSGSPAEDQQVKQLEIAISAEGVFSVNNQVLEKNDLNSLMDALQKESGGDTKMPLSISADGKTQHQAVVTAMDAAGKLGFSHLRMSTVEAASQP
jgi:biopolymer transport protein ExbD